MTSVVERGKIFFLKERHDQSCAGRQKSSVLRKTRDWAELFFCKIRRLREEKKEVNLVGRPGEDEDSIKGLKGKKCPRGGEIETGKKNY